ncbi:polysaccharide pyruvyl transferase family protein [Capnocytophaga canis]|uniref:polysaccharide pyruvyl transferase family protein n=1 Tax=Capnocytophaga canis TaxID=1848903 RepID=UPI00370D9A0A
MKIGILTFHRSINNGAFMQAYALSQQIQRRFGDIVEIIDFELESKHHSYKKNSLNKLIVYGGKYMKKYRQFQNALNLLPLSPDTLITNNYEKVREYIQKRYDIVIVGSDAVWAYSKGLGLENPYWLFGEKLDCVKMSYAASAYSLDVKNVPSDHKEYIADCLNSFSYIGVRDDETKNFVQSLNSSLKINMNCDPTVLLDKPSKAEAEVILKRRGISTDKKIIGIMLSNSDYIPAIIKMLGRKEYEFLDVHRRNYSKNKHYFSTNKSLFDLSPYEWYQVYSHFYMNFTNFFHGTLLALKSNVPTFSFDNTNFDYEYLSKIRQLLIDLDLLDYWVDNTQYSREEQDRVFAQIEYTIKNYETIKEKIDKNMEMESRKADSFFEYLSKLIP